MKNFLVLTLLFGLAGCASVTHDAMQPLKIETLTADGLEVIDAECTLANDFATWFARSGETVKIHRSGQNLSVSCISNDQAEAKGSVVSRKNAGMVGNAFLGGAIGVLIDHNSGTGYSYPSWIKLVFGQTRVYDRKSETDGLAVHGTLDPSFAPTDATPIATAVKPSVVVKSTNAIVSKTSGQARPARLSDADAIPYLGSNGRNAYREWLGKSAPKAFAIAPNGWYEWAQGVNTQDRTMPGDPSQRALLICERGAKRPCKLYAVDDAIVWDDTAAAPAALTVSSE